MNTEIKNTLNIEMIRDVTISKSHDIILLRYEVHNTIV